MTVVESRFTGGLHLDLGKKGKASSEEEEALDSFEAEEVEQLAQEHPSLSGDVLSSEDGSGEGHNNSHQLNMVLSSYLIYLFVDVWS